MSTFIRTDMDLEAEEAAMQAAGNQANKGKTQTRRVNVKSAASRLAVTGFAILAILGFLSPLILSFTVSFKSIDQLSNSSSILPHASFAA